MKPIRPFIAEFIAVSIMSSIVACFFGTKENLCWKQQSYEGDAPKKMVWTVTIDAVIWKKKCKFKVTLDYTFKYKYYNL